MILNICNNINIFNLVHSNVIYLLCFFSLLFSFFVFFKFRFNFAEKGFIKRHYIVFICLILLCFFMISVLYMMINSKKYNGCVCAEIKDDYLAVNSHLFDPKLEKVVYKARKDKIIVIGDSRMEYILNKKDEIDIPENFTIIAKSGASYDWFYETIVFELYNILDNRDKGYNYYVVMNVGVNDIQYFKNYQPSVDKYIEDYNNLALKYPGVDFYILSINPINDDKLNEFQPQNIRTTKKIEDFNSQLISDVEEVNMKNLKYCDAYHDIYFHTKDGLHYTEETGQDTLNYIRDKCVIYKQKQL